MKIVRFFIALIFLLLNSSTAQAGYHVLALDIEISGCSLSKNGILSIGASLQDQDSNEVESFQVNLTLPLGRTFEERCMREFWSNE